MGSDFIKLNEMIVRKPFPMPKISDILMERQEYSHFTKIDLLMMLYCFKLDKESQKICVISTEHGCYAYTRLTMGVKISPDVAQQYMTEMLQGIPNTSCYIDDVGIWTKGTFSENLDVVDAFLERFSKKNMKCNPLKCDWAVQETDFLGFWIIPEGVKPWSKIIEPILAMSAPNTQTYVRAFIGSVNNYRSLWPRRAHILAPLRKLTGKGKFIWKPIHQKAFDEMKAIIVADAINAFPDYFIPFHVYTDASDLQPGATIIQRAKPIAYYIKSLPQLNKIIQQQRRNC